MPKAEDGATYDDWKMENSMDPAGAAYMMVTLYDAKGRPQLVRGSGVPAMLDKADSGGGRYFYPYRVDDGVDVEEEIVYLGVPTPSGDTCPHCEKTGYKRLAEHIERMHP